MRKYATIGLAMLLVACSTSSEDGKDPDSMPEEYRTPLDLQDDDFAGLDLGVDADAVATHETTAPEDATPDGAPGDELTLQDVQSETVAEDVQSPEDTTAPEETTPETNVQDVVLEDMEEPDETTAVDISIDIPQEVPPEEQKNASVDLSTYVVRKAIFEDHLTVTCKTVNGYGDLIDDPGTYEIVLSTEDIIEDEQGILFPEPGNYEASCVDEENGLEATAQFVVSHEAVSPSVTALSASLAKQSGLIRQALDAAAADDQQGLDEAVANLKDQANQTALLEPEVVISPPGGWPSQQQVQQLFDPEPDDEAYLELLGQISQEVVAFSLALDALTTTPSQDNAALVLQKADTLAQLTGQMQALQPGVRALNQAMPIWKQTVATLTQSQEDYADLLADMLSNPDAYQPPSCPNCITLVGLATTMAVGAILSYIPSYQGLLMQAGKAAASMAIMMAIADAIDAAFKPGPGAPEIQYVSPGYSNAVNDGAALSLFVSGFDYGQGNNAVIFIGPGIGDAAAGAIFIVIDGIKAVKGMKNWSNAWELANAMKDAFSALKGTVKELGTTIPDIAEKGCVSLPVLSVDPFVDFDDFWEQIVNLGPLPLVNDSWLPKVGILIPMSFTRGVGETYKIVILP
jgi:hypothetical protein